MKKQKNYTGGTAPIYLRITVAGKRSETTTSRECEPGKWNPKAGRMTGTKEDTKSFNAYLDNLQAKVYDAHKALTESNTPATAENIRDRFLGRTEQSGHTLLKAIKDHNNKLAALVGKEYAAGTLARFEVLERHMSAFLEFRYKTKDINIKDIDHAFISEFEFYLRTEKKCATNTAVKYLKNMGKIIRICLSNKWLDRDPMFGYKLKSKKVERAFLTHEELQEITKKEFRTERLSQVRDIFLFCCYTGLAYADIHKLQHSHISKGIDGKQWVFTNRKKTGSRTAIPLFQSAIAILERYRDNPYCLNTGQVLPVNSNQKMNEYLKELATVCGITKPLSMHIARHTFATTVTLLNGVPIESVSKMLGHTNIRTTQIYAKVLDIKVSADMAAVSDKYAV